VLTSNVGTTTTYFVGTHYEVTNGVITKYYYAGTQRIAMRKNGTLTYLFGDHLGSTSIVTDSSGALISETKYKAWGETRYESGTNPSEYTYTGQYSYTDDFGLMYYGARWYDSSLGRFAQADSLLPSMQEFDRYSYVGNNPINYKDPSGHCRIDAKADDCLKPDKSNIPKMPWVSPTLPPMTIGGYDYGDDNGTELGHIGVDIDVSLNDEIFASADGIVLSSDPCSLESCDGLDGRNGVVVNGGYGNLIVIEYPYENLPPKISLQIENGQSIYIIYAHLNEPSYLQTGDSVVAGQVIGFTGNTGNSTGVHLHLEVRVGNDLPSLPMATVDFSLENELWYHWWGTPHVDPHNIFPIP
jgi:RHS repeat-associated protein